ncbi:phosphonatase-like hydrolase [Rhodococcus pseudokoreensis]|uniref:Phosphonatase-like hydrolase n=1 Tax=Rhodococcus pseudokoreensis TaxID=2811421 RepID=A0A974W705_9NOCA|nr:phosphonatase-like hydrolase [Rhodococcus pseudokoreensis]QSE91807.1 phosphonatase-like hydrolase [Rhodococcus pseudokoreensis]
MTEPRVSLVTLDIAGTSVDEGGAVYVALRDTVENYLGGPIPDDRFDRWKGTGKRQAIEGLLRESGAHADTAVLDSVESEFTAMLLAAYRKTPPTALPGVHDAFGTLRQRGIKIVLQTGYSREIARPLLEQVGWEIGRDIDGVITSDQVRTSRPSPYLIFRAMELAGVQSVDEVLVGGDTPNDLRAGTNAGARYVVGVLTGAHDAATLRPEPHTHLLESAAKIPDLLG